jgi:hypothetical protein
MAGFLILIFATTLSTVYAADSQSWNEVDATHLLNENLTATGIVTARVGNGLPNPTLSAAGVQIDYRVGSWTSTATGYYVSVRDLHTGIGTAIWLPAAALTYSIDVGRLKVSDRNRLEQLEGIAGTPTRYRNRASLTWAVSEIDRLTDAFIADELFYDFTKGRWSRNRIQAGIQCRVTGTTQLQVFYMRQNDTYGALNRLNVLGVTLHLDVK